MQHPLLTAGGPHASEFGLVRRHANWLRDWFTRNTGWTLQIDSELARLRKTAADVSDGTRPARDARTDCAFSRRRYALLCLALAALERSDRQTTLKKLADDILAFAAADPALAAAGIEFDLSSRDQRRDLVQVVRLVLDLRVLVRVDGDEDQYLNENRDVLYNVNRPALAAMVNVKRGPSTVQSEKLDERIASIVDEFVPDTEEGRNRKLRTRLTRRLLDDPIVYFNDLTGDEQAYLTSQRGHMVRQIQEATGLIPEVRREGIAMVDDAADMTDLGLPEEGTDGHLTLLLAEYLARQAREESMAFVSYTALYALTTDLIAEHRSHWRRDVAQPGAEVELVRRTVERLAALRLVQCTENGVTPLPAVGRYALAETEELIGECAPPANRLMLQEAP